METSDIKNRLINGNEKFVKNLSKDKNKKELVKKLVEAQHPYALIIACSDSRVAPEEIFSASLGELFVIRTAGNVINEGEFASVEYGIEHLNIPYILVLGHTHCGAVHAAMHHESGIFVGVVLNKIAENIKDIDDECEAAKINAIKQAQTIKEKFPTYQGRIESAIYELETNKVVFLK